MLGIAAAGGLVGALLAPTLVRRLSPRLALVGENWMLALSLPWLLVVHNALLLGLIVAAAELVTPVTNSIVVSYRVGLAPDRLQGRVQAASTLISFSAAWLGPLLIGQLLAHAGSTATILTLTGWGLALALFATASRAFRNPPTMVRRGSGAIAASSRQGPRPAGGVSADQRAGAGDERPGADQDGRNARRLTRLGRKLLGQHDASDGDHPEDHHRTRDPHREHHRPA